LPGDDVKLTGAENIGPFFYCSVYCTKKPAKLKRQDRLKLSKLPNKSFDKYNTFTVYPWAAKTLWQPARSAPIFNKVKNDSTADF
jgi:hypothetical protein